MNRNGTTAPVIVQAQHLAAFAPDQVRFASHVYRIEREERFVSLPPTWRDYLFVGLVTRADDSIPAFSSRPLDGQELTLCQDSVRAGWVEGTKQADAILEANFNRLTRDYTGMILYTALLRQGMISATRVAESSLTVTGDGRQLILGDSLRRLTGRAAFDIDHRNWLPALSYAPVSAAASPAAQPGDGKYRPAKR